MHDKLIYWIIFVWFSFLNSFSTKISGITIPPAKELKNCLLFSCSTIFDSNWGAVIPLLSKISDRQRQMSSFQDLGDADLKTDSEALQFNQISKQQSIYQPTVLHWKVLWIVFLNIIMRPLLCKTGWVTFNLIWHVQGNIYLICNDNIVCSLIMKNGQLFEFLMT